MIEEEIVSIIMPLFNCEDFVGQTIDSILSQSYRNWELIVVDDCSSDGSASIVQSYTSDNRIKLFFHSENKGAAEARNTALQYVEGQFLAYIDSDDLWYPQKLEKQIEFMKKSEAGMCFTSYETVSEDGDVLNVVRVPDSISYKGFLKNTITCSHTVMFDLNKVSLSWLHAPRKIEEYDFPEDMATWLQVLKQGVAACGMNLVLAKYRKRQGSRSSNHFSAVRRTWNQYRRYEGLPLLYSCYCLFWQLTHAVMKRI